MASRPDNPYRKGTMLHDLMEGSLQGEFDGKVGWEDMTAEQIGEVLQMNTETVMTYIGKIRRETKYNIRYVRKPIGRKRN